MRSRFVWLSPVPFGWWDLPPDAFPLPSWYLFSFLFSFGGPGGVELPSLHALGGVPRVPPERTLFSTPKGCGAPESP